MLLLPSKPEPFSMNNPKYQQHLAIDTAAQAREYGLMLRWILIFRFDNASCYLADQQATAKGSKASNRIFTFLFFSCSLDQGTVFFFWPSPGYGYRVTVDHIVHGGEP